MKKQFLMIIISLLLSLCFGLSKAQDMNNEIKNVLKEGKSLIDKAYLTGDTAMYSRASTMFNHVLDLEPANGLALYYLVYIEYSLLGMGFNPKYTGLFEKNIDSAMVHVDKIMEIKGFESEGNALAAAIYMMRIAKYPAEAASLSCKISGFIAVAEEKNQDNPRPYIIDGIMKYRTPEAFGGDKNEAINILKKSMTLFEKQKNIDSLMPDWGYLEAHAWLGQLLVEQESYDEAEFLYRKALSIEPEFGWIKYYLLPKLEKLKSKTK
jgi:tetratricopeptide (TPR) repeat protein